jgi:uncharacterized repeat protein (TIGR02543 family)
MSSYQSITNRNRGLLSLGLSLSLFLCAACDQSVNNHTTLVDLLDLSPAVTAPVKDAAPNTTALNTPQYTGTIAWKTASGEALAGNFAESTVYQAEAALSAKPGYTFSGLAANSFTHTGAEQVTHGAGGGTNLTVTLTFPATEPGVLLRFETKGGSAVPSQSLTKGGAVSRPETAPLKTGYNFGNWYTDEMYTQVYDIDLPVNGDTNVYARWTPITYTVAFDPNGGSGSAINSIPCTYDVEQRLPAAAFTPPSGTLFALWNTKPAGDGKNIVGAENGVIITDECWFKNLTDTDGATVTLYAQWNWNSGAVKNMIDDILSGGTSAADPASLGLTIQLSDANWTAILTGVNEAGKFISLNLSNCPPSGSSVGGGLHSTGDFNPADFTSNGDPNQAGFIAAGKAKITAIILPTGARGMVAGTHLNPVFKDFTALKTVSGAEVTSIGSYAFSGCTALTSASFPLAATIGLAAFSDTGLTDASFPEAQSIGEGAFSGCTALSSVDFPKAATIGNTAFLGSGLTGSVSFPEATGIGNNAFSSSGYLTSVSFPKVQSIGEGAFSGCTALTSVDFPKAATIGRNAFSGSALNSANFPEATSIGDSAFSNCTALTSASFPKAASLGQSAFSGSALTDLTLGPTPPTLGSFLFFDIDTARTVTVTIPVDAKDAYGVPGLPGTNFNNDSVDNSWGRAFKGLGWNGTSYGDNSASVNTAITLDFQIQSP